MGVTPFNELFITYENMQTKSEIEEELMKTQDILTSEPDLSSDDAIDDMAGIVDHHYMKGYIDALKWVLRNEVN